MTNKTDFDKLNQESFEEVSKADPELDDSWREESIKYADKAEHLYSCSTGFGYENVTRAYMDGVDTYKQQAIKALEERKVVLDNYIKTNISPITKDSHIIQLNELASCIEIIKTLKAPNESKTFKKD